MHSIAVFHTTLLAYQRAHEYLSHVLPFQWFVKHGGNTKQNQTMLLKKFRIRKAVGYGSLNSCSGKDPTVV